MNIKEIQSQIKKDKHFKKFSSIINTHIEHTNPMNLIDEIRDISEIRTKTSVLYTSQKSDLLKSILEENLKAQAYRSRLAEICIQCTRIVAKIKSASEKLKDYIHVNYNESIQECGRTKEERAMVVNSLLYEANAYINRISSVVEMAEILISDIDKQHYSLKLSIDALNLHVNKEQIL